MTNKQYYSCERNHYFFGKLMTVRDFECEQIYFNSKRRLGNRFLGGAGIVAGLDVILVDSKTFSLEAGMAIDYSGREIVVAEPNVKRLNVISGFEENRESDDLYLCIGYKEDLKESTFSVAGSGKDSGVSQEYNRVHEGYELFITSKRPSISVLGARALITKQIPLYNKNGIKLDLEVSRYVNPGKSMKITVLFEKSSVSAPVKYQFDIGGEFFKTNNGSNSLHIDYYETEVATYKRFKKEYYLVCDAVSDAFVDLVVNKDSFKMEIGQDVDTLQGDVKESIIVATKPLRDVIIENYYLKHFDDMVEEKEGQYIYLAKFHVTSNQATYFIESFEKHPFKQYLLNNELLTILQDFCDEPDLKPYIQGNESTQIIEEKVTKKEDKDDNESKENNIITGVEKINLGFYPKVGKTYYSYEFVHGLGYGKIGVMVAIENKADYLTDNDNALMFGDTGIFSGEENSMSGVNAEIGAVVNPDKGTMKLGIRLREKSNVQSVDVRWWAFKPDDIQEESHDNRANVSDGVKVVVTPNTAKVEPLCQIRFTAKAEGLNTQEFIWSVTETGSGTIDSNGIYTAPSKEGVYEIKAQSAKFPDKSDSAYVVVSSAE